MKRRVNLSQTSAATYIRSMEMHSWPVFEKAARTAPDAALPTSESARMRMAFFPPSSIE